MDAVPEGPAVGKQRSSDGSSRSPITGACLAPSPHARARKLSVSITRTQALLVEEARYWAKALPQLECEQDQLFAAGRDHAMAALSADPRVTPSLAVIFARRFLRTTAWQGDRGDEQLQALFKREGVSQALADEVSSLIRRVSASEKKCGMSSYMLDRMVAIGELLALSPEILRAMQEETVREFVALTKISLPTMLQDLELSDTPRRVSTLAIAVAHAKRERPHAVDADWLFKELETTAQCLAGVRLEAALLAGGNYLKPEILATFKAQVLVQVSQERDPNLARSEFYHRRQLALLQRGYLSLRDDDGRADAVRALSSATQLRKLQRIVSDILLASQSVPPVDPPALRIVVGDEVIDLGERSGRERSRHGLEIKKTPEPISRAQAVEQVAEIEATCGNFPRGKAGYEALSALVDPSFRDQAHENWSKALQSFGADLVLRDMLALLAEFEEMGNPHFLALRAEVAGLLVRLFEEKATSEESLRKDLDCVGAAVQSLIYYLPSSIFTPEQNAAILVSALQGHRQARSLTEAALEAAQGPTEKNTLRHRLGGITQRSGMLFDVLARSVQFPFAALPAKTFELLGEWFSSSMRVQDQHYAQIEARLRNRS